MESNRKITEIVEDTKIYFLEGHLLKEEKFSPTSIEEEYLKKGNKKNYQAIVSLISFVIIALASTLIITEFMVGKNIEVVVDINSFRALDVAQIVQNIKDSQKELRTLKFDIISNESELNTKIGSIENNSIEMIERLNVKDIGQDAYRIEIDRINEQRDRDIQEIVNNYESIISDTMARISEIEDGIKEQQDDLSIKRTDSIEAPDQYRDIPIDPNIELVAQNEEYRQLINILSNEMITNRSNLDLAQANLDTLQSRNVNIIDLERQIEELNRQNAQLSNEYSAYISNNTVTTNIIDVKPQINSIPIDNIAYHKALEYLLLQRRDGAGYIISNNNDDIDIFISSSYEIENGEKIFVFRGGKFLAELEITSNSKPLAKAKILRSVNDSTIIPFDIVLLSLNK